MHARSREVSLKGTQVTQAVCVTACAGLRVSMCVFSQYTVSVWGTHQKPQQIRPTVV